MYQTYIYKKVQPKQKQNTPPPIPNHTINIHIHIHSRNPPPHLYQDRKAKKRKSEHTIYTYVFRPLIRKATLFAPYRTRGSLPSSSLPPSLPPRFVRSFVRMWYELRSDYVCNQTPIQCNQASLLSPPLLQPPAQKNKSSLRSHPRVD